MPQTRQTAAPGALTGLAMVTLTLLGWSSIPLFLKHFTHLIDGWTANGWRYSIAALLWAPAIALAWQRKRLPASIWAAALLPSLFNAAGQVCFAIAPYHIGPGLMTFALRVQIVFVTAGAAILFASERRVVKSPGFLLGVGLVIVGTCGTILFKQGGLRGAAAGGGHGNEVLGVALSIGSGLLYACYSLSVRHFMRGTNPLTAFAVISQYTALLILPTMLIWAEPGAAHHWRGGKALEMGMTELFYLALSGIIGIGLGHTFYYISIERLGVAVSSGVIQLQPIFVSIASMFLFGEVMTPVQWGCGALAITGAGVILYTQHRMSAAAPPAPGPKDLREFRTLPVDADVAAAVAETERPRASAS
jgi:drug/metabolite transporter (DMT)-like permease